MSRHPRPAVHGIDHDYRTINSAGVSRPVGEGDIPGAQSYVSGQEDLHSKRRRETTGGHRTVPSPRLPYQRPYSEEGQWLSFDVPLRMIPALSRDSTSHIPSSSTTTMCIAAANQRTSEDSVVIELSCIQSEPEWEGLRWVHVEDRNVSIDSFNRLIYSIPGVTSKEMVLAERILYDLKAKRTNRSTDSGSANAGTILRYDSRDDFGDESARDALVTFLSIPYFLTKKASETLSKARASTKTLIEALYPFERAANRDNQQIFSIYAHDSKSNIICMSQTFVLVFANVLLTYSELPASTIGGSVLRYVNIDGSAQRSVLARITNPVGDVVHIDIDPVPSYFVFLEQIKLRCLGQESVNHDHVELFFDDGTKLDATSWLAKTESSPSAILNVQAHLRLALRPPSPPYPLSVHGLSLNPYEYKDPRSIHALPPQQVLDGCKNYSPSGPRVTFEHSDSESDDDTSLNATNRRLLSNDGRFPSSDADYSIRKKMPIDGESEPIQSGIATLSYLPRDRDLNVGRADRSGGTLVNTKSDLRFTLNSKARDGVLKPLLNDPNYRISKFKPQIYHIPESTILQKDNTPRQMICPAKEANAESRAPQEDLKSNVGEKFEWGFIWKGKYLSELRDVPAPVYAPNAFLHGTIDSHLEHHGASTTHQQLSWDQTKIFSPRRPALMSSSKSTEEPRQRGDRRLVRAELRSDSNNVGHSVSRESSKSRSDSMDSSDRLALVPFNFQKFTSQIRSLYTSAAYRQRMIADPSHPRDEGSLKRRLIDATPADPIHTFYLDNAVERWSSGSKSQQVVSRTLPQPTLPSPPSNPPEFKVPVKRPQLERGRGRTQSSYATSYESKRSSAWSLRVEKDSLPGPHHEGRQYSYGIRQRDNVTKYPRHTQDIKATVGYPHSLRVNSPESSSGEPTHRPRENFGVNYLPQRGANKPEGIPSEFVEDRRKLYNRTVPPFFAWVDSNERRTDVMLPDLTKLESILRNIHEKLESGLSDQTRKMYRRAREMELRDLEAARADLESKANIYSRNHCLTVSGADALFASLRKQTRADNAIDTSDLLSLWTSVHDYSSRTVELFLPAMVKGKPLLKVWGALSFYSQALQDTNLQGSQLYNGSPKPNRWMIQDTEICFEISKHLPVNSPFEFKHDCWCKNQVFNSRGEAVDHLFERHYRKPNPPLFTRALLKYFVTTAASVFAKQRLADLLNPFEHFHSFLCDFHAQVEAIALGVATADRNLRTTLQLTVSLVESFEKYLLAHAKAVHLLAFIDRHYRDRLEGANVDRQVYEERRSHLDDELGLWCSSTLEIAKKAYHEIVVLSQAETHVSAIQLNSVGVPSIVAGLLSAAQSTVFDSGADIVTQYDACLAKLQYQVNQHPRKKLLHHIHHLEEELASIRQTIEMSKILLRNFARTLRPESFRMTTRSRHTLYPIEDDFLKRTYRVANGQLRSLERFQMRSQHLVAQVKRSVEILEEDHGKAILTFTIITTIFLPLSFIASFFGMNTYDIRNMTGGQWVFWTAAIPFTAMIASLVLLMAFKGGDMLEIIGIYSDLKWQGRRVFSLVANAADLTPWRTPKRTGTDLTNESV